MKYPNGYLTVGDAASVGACIGGILAFATHEDRNGKVFTSRTMSVPVALKQAGTSWHWDYVVMAILDKYKLTMKFADYLLELSEGGIPRHRKQFIRSEYQYVLACNKGWMNIDAIKTVATMSYRLGNDKRGDLNKWLIAAVRAEVQATKGEESA